jgi:hypothetical protein
MAFKSISRRLLELSLLADLAEYSARNIDRTLRAVPNIPVTDRDHLLAIRDGLRDLAQKFAQLSGFPLPGNELDSDA